MPSALVPEYLFQVGIHPISSITKTYTCLKFDFYYLNSRSWELIFTGRLHSTRLALIIKWWGGRGMGDLSPHVFLGGGHNIKCPPPPPRFWDRMKFDRNYVTFSVWNSIFGLCRSPPPPPRALISFFGTCTTFGAGSMGKMCMPRNPLRICATVNDTHVISHQNSDKSMHNAHHAPPIIAPPIIITSRSFCNWYVCFIKSHGASCMHSLCPESISQSTRRFKLGAGSVTCLASAENTYAWICLRVVALNIWICMPRLPHFAESKTEW